MGLRINQRENQIPENTQTRRSVIDIGNKM
jgi:hypothetical protein